MASRSAILSVKVLVDQAKAASDVDNMASKFDKFAAGIDKGARIAGASFGAAAVVVGKIASAYGELEQNLGGADAVFGRHAETLKRTGADAFKTLGLSTSDYLATANKMGALFQGTGIEQREALGLTTKAMQRAADMASVMGIDQTVAMEAVEGAAKNNFTMMDNLGVAMNATSIEAYALSRNMDFKWSTASEAEKARVAMEMFFDRTSQYAGNFERESQETISGSLGQLKAAYENLVAGMGNPDADFAKLTKDLTGAFGAVIDNIKPLIANIFGNLPTQAKIAVVAIGGIGAAFIGLSTAFKAYRAASGVVGQSKRVFDAVAGSVGRFRDGFKNANAAASSFSGMAGTAGGKVRALGSGIASATATTGRWIAAQTAAAASGARAAAVWVAQRTATLASTVATKAATAGQWLLNAALTANPIGIVIALVAALVAAVVLLWNKNEGFRKAMLAAWAAVTGAVSAAVAKIRQVFDGVVSWFRNIPGRVASSVSGVGSQVRAKFDQARAGAQAVFDSAVTWFRNIPSRIASAIGNIASQVRAKFDQARAGAQGAFDALVSWVRGIPGRVLSALGSVGSLLSNAGRQIIDGFLGGLRRSFENVKNFVGGIGSWIAKHKGPKAYDLALLRPAGGWIMTGLNDSMQAQLGTLRRTVRQVANTISGGLPGGSGIGGLLGRAATGANVATPITVNAVTAEQLAAAFDGLHLVVEVDGQPVRGIVRTELARTTRLRTMAVRA